MISGDNESNYTWLDSCFCPSPARNTGNNWIIQELKQSQPLWTQQEPINVEKGWLLKRQCHEILSPFFISWIKPSYDKLAKMVLQVCNVFVYPKIFGLLVQKVRASVVTVTVSYIFLSEENVMPRRIVNKSVKLKRN